MRNFLNEYGLEKSIELFNINHPFMSTQDYKGFDDLLQYMEINIDYCDYKYLMNKNRN
ncbi:hypothetical protein AB6L40_01275 [Paraclostridium bifermentans]